MVDRAPPASVETVKALDAAAWVWYCGDDCGCSQARILTARNRYGGFTTQAWEGTFFSDWERGATTELNRVAKKMRRKWPDAYHAIEWPWDR